MKDIKQALVGVVVTGLGGATTFTSNATLGIIVAAVGLVVLINGALD